MTAVSFSFGSIAVYRQIEIVLTLFETANSSVDLLKDNVNIAPFDPDKITA